MDARINVVVRCRPLNEAEQRAGRRALSIVDDGVQVADKRFPFETVLSENVSQEDVYDSCVRELVDGCFAGFNATVLAYGQTGSGKTFSIMGAADTEDEGIIPRAVKQIFHRLHSMKSTHVANVRVSMIELYNDECKDLLHPEIPTRDIMIREDKHGRIFFTGAREEAITSVRGALDFLETGNLNRSTAETLMNQTSSRSHAIFTVSLEMIEYEKEGAVEERSFIHAKLHLVDLAGSERAKKTGAVGTRFKESVGINQGLLALGKVIRALTSHPVTHVPYRESKLTRFLQDSLGGNSRTVLIACVSTSDYNMHETLSTLQYALRARAVHNKVVANVSKAIGTPEDLDLQAELESSLVQSLRAEIARMQQHKAGLQLEGAALRDDSKETKDLRTRLASCGQLLRTVRHSVQRMAYKCEDAQELREIGDQVISALKDGILRLEDPAAPNALRASLRESVSSLQKVLGGNPENAEEALHALRQELEECKEDLQRDEMIFAEKMKEIKNLKKQIKDSDAANKKLSADLSLLRKNLGKLTGLAKVRTMQVEDPEDLDLSIAVAAAEPDISQLMEDLEALASEKDTLRDRFQTDLRDQLAAAQESWGLERKDWQRQCDEWRRKVKDLERNDLEHRAAEDSLRSTVQRLEQVVQSEEAARKDAERELRAIQAESRSQGRQADDQVQALRVAKDNAEERHREAVELLNKQVDDLQSKVRLQASERRKMVHDAEAIRQREKDLEAQVQRLTKEVDGLRFDQNRQESSAKMLHGKDSLAVLRDWVNSHIDDLVCAGVVQLEMGKLQKTLEILKAERQNLWSELSEKRSETSHHAQELHDQVRDIADKIKALTTKLSVLKRKLLVDRDSDLLQDEAEDVKQSLAAYEEHRQECLDRIAQLERDPAVPGDDEQELLEEIEGLDTEITLVQSRLLEEQTKLSKRAAVAANADYYDQGVETILKDLQAFGTQRFHSATLVTSPLLARLLLQLVITERVTSGARDTSIKTIQSQLDTKCTEYDELVKTMQRMRSEQMRRLEQQRRESDEKVAFLLQQLKSAEQRASTPGSARSSANLLGRTPRDGTASHSQAALAHLLQSAQRQTMGQLLQDLAQDPNGTTSASVAGPSPALANVNVEVVRRYAAEKERREQLERRNLEMARELRTLRDQR